MTRRNGGPFAHNRSCRSAIGLRRTQRSPQSDAGLTVVSDLDDKAVEAITNLHTDDVERAREFFGFLGLTEDGMNQGAKSGGRRNTFQVLGYEVIERLTRC